MLLKAGALSLALLLASRLLGLLRESALAATFGASGLGDVAVLMLTLPDWIAGMLASGALAYVLLPAWVASTPAQVASTQRQMSRMLFVAGVALALALVILRVPAAGWLAGGLPESIRSIATYSLLWSALALPAALLAALWTTRLQHGRDFLGMYSAGIVVNLVVLAAIAGAARGGGDAAAVTWLGSGLLAAMSLRLAWLGWRQAPARVRGPLPDAALPPLALWLWAMLSAGLPLALPFVARSLASHSGEGALATFNYAWKLVELPLLLAIQLVATLFFPAIAAVLSKEGSPREPQARDPVRTAFGLAFALACACTAGLVAGAPALARLLFGWGRMDPDALAQVADWARIGAWGLPSQAVIAVALTVLAARRRMKAAVLAYALALAAMLALGVAGVNDGGALMMAMNVLLTAVAVATVFAMGQDAWRWLPWRLFAASLAALLVLTGALTLLPVPSGIAAGIGVAVLWGGIVLASSWLAERGVRRT